MAEPRGPDPLAQAYHDLCQGVTPDLARFLAGSGPVLPLGLAAVVRVDQRELWRMGVRKNAAEYLREYPALRDDPEAEFELIYSEWLLREELGDAPNLDDYRREYPAHAESLALQVDLHRALDTETGLTGLGSGLSTPVSAARTVTRASPMQAGLEGPANSPAVSVPGYEVLGELGRGGMGVVYKARQLRLNRLCALKMVLAGELSGPDVRARFLQEARAIAQLDHPNFVQIRVVGEHDGRPFLELEYAAGGNLADRLDGNPRPAEEAARLVETLARAIHDAHRRGVVHRDLKPANVLLTADGTPKIGDFGLAKLKVGDAADLTRSGVILGTPAYMAPEQARGDARDIGPAADVYALGVILYELLTGRGPFRGATPLETLEQVQSMDPAPPRSLRPKLARDLEVICLKCLEKEPAYRYPDAEALADDLRRYLRGEPIVARPSGPFERLARSIGTGQFARDFRTWGDVTLRTTPAIFATHLGVFILAQTRARYVTLALALPLALLLGFQLYIAALRRRRTHVLSNPTARLLGASVSGQILAGLASIESARRLAPADLPFRELAVYPFWSVIVGMMYITLGANHGGYFTLAGLACIVLSPIMTLDLQWAPLELGALITLCHILLGLHLRSKAREAAESAGDSVIPDRSPPTES